MPDQPSSLIDNAEWQANTDPIDILLRWETYAPVLMALEPVPYDHPGPPIVTLATRRMSLLPIKPDAPERYIFKSYSGDRKARITFPAMKLGGGISLISDRVKAIFDEFDCPRLEYIPVTAYAVSKEADLTTSGPTGVEIEEPYWLMNCYNNYDVIDKTRTVTNWYRPTDAVIDSSAELYSRDDPSWAYPPFHLVLSSVPHDAMFGIVGLPGDRFVSEQLFDRMIRSRIFDDPTTPLGRFNLMPPFHRFALNSDEQGYGGYRTGDTPKSRAPLRLNGRTLYHGDMTTPLDAE